MPGDRSGHRDYSHVPLWRKLGIREGASVVLLGAPGSPAAMLGPLPDGVTIAAEPAPGSDVIVWFPTTAAELAGAMPALAAALSRAGGVWVAYPKKASRVPTELDFGLVQRAGLEAGLVDNKVASIDAVYTGVRFVRRRADRS